MKVRNNEARVHTLGGAGEGRVRLAPGVNEVDAEKWKKATSNPGPVLKHLFKERVLEVIDHSGTVQATPTAPTTKKGAKADTGDLSGVPPENALELIADTFDRDTLTRWLKTEKRPDIQGLLKDQLELTNPATPPKK